MDLDNSLIEKLKCIDHIEKSMERMLRRILKDKRRDASVQMENHYEEKDD